MADVSTVMDASSHRVLPVLPAAEDAKDRDRVDFDGERDHEPALEAHDAQAGPDIVPPAPTLRGHVETKAEGLDSVDGAIAVTGEASRAMAS